MEKTHAEVKHNTAKKLLLGAVFIVIIAIGVSAYAGYSYFVGPGVDARSFELSRLPIDQPSPLPSSGQVDMIGRYCDIVTPQIAKEIGATSSPIQVKGPIGACDIPLDGGALIQISSVGPYGRLSRSDNPHFSQSVTIAGLGGRIYNLSAPLSGECTLKLNTRSVTVPTINVRWYLSSDLERATRRAKSCEIAKKAGEVFAKAYVPLAGGAVYEKTLQKPAVTSIGTHPCRVVGNGAALIADVYDVRDDQNGKQKERQNRIGQCTYQHAGNKAVVTLDMSGKGLDMFPTIEGGTKSMHQLGVLSARVSKTDNTCSVAVELSPGVVSDVVYTAVDQTESCLRAELMQASSIKTLIDMSSVR